MIRRTWRRWLPGSNRASAARTARSAHDSLGFLTWRWSTATWWRKIRISASFARSERASKATRRLRRFRRRQPRVPAGRRLGPVAERRLLGGERGARGRAWATRALGRYGVRIIVVQIAKNRTPTSADPDSGADDQADSRDVVGYHARLADRMSSTARRMGSRASGAGAWGLRKPGSSRRSAWKPGLEVFSAESGAELLRIAALLIPDPHAAEDVNQETPQRLAARWSWGVQPLAS